MPYPQPEDVVERTSDGKRFVVGTALFGSSVPLFGLYPVDGGDSIGVTGQDFEVRPGQQEPAYRIVEAADPQSE